MKPTISNIPFQRLGGLTNSQVGREFERAAQVFFAGKGIQLESSLKVSVGVESEHKLHAFDLGCESKKVVVECKSHRWTAGGKVPSAKLTVWNEAMLYFIAMEPGYRKIMFVLKDLCSKRNETLAQHYLRRYSHLVPKDVEFWEYDEAESSATQIYNQ